MTREELAATLNGREYGNEISRDEIKAAKEKRLLVAFGASDDLMEFYGAMCDEEGVYNGGTVPIVELPDGRLFVPEKRDDANDLIRAGWTPPKVLLTIKAEWVPKDVPGASWLITTDKPHSTFDIMEDGEIYCRGIVVDLNNI